MAAECLANSSLTLVPEPLFAASISYLLIIHPYSEGNYGRIHCGSHARAHVFHILLFAGVISDNNTSVVLHRLPSQCLPSKTQRDVLLLHLFL